jgi:hypothetical protein
MDALEADVENGMRTSAAAHGVTPAQRYVVRDPKTGEKTDARIWDAMLDGDTRAQWDALYAYLRTLQNSSNP